MAGRGVRTRFNLLLLEEGEWLLEEASVAMWTVMPAPDGRSLEAAAAADAPQRGRLRVGTRALYFEPDNAALPIAKYGLRTMRGRPVLLPDSAVASSLQPLVRAQPDAHARSFFAAQVVEEVEMKPSNTIAPYKTRTFDDLSAPAAGAADAAGAAAPGGGGKAAAGGKGGKGGGKGAAAAAAAAEAAAALRLKEGAHTHGRHTLVFTLTGAGGAGGGGTPLALVALLQQLWALQQAAAKAHSGYERAQLEPILAARREGAFDMSLLQDFREKPALPPAPVAVGVERVFPLVTVPGRLMVTDRAIYLQPVAINNIAGSDPVSKWPLRDVRRVLRRRRLLAETGLELQLAEAAGAGAAASGTSTGSDIAAAGLRPTSPWAQAVLLQFANRAQRDEAFRAVLGALRARARAPGSVGTPSPFGGGGASLLRRAPSAGGFDVGDGGGGTGSSTGDYDDELGDPSPAALAAVTRLWQTRAVSNFDYLWFLNSAAGRSVCDLTQYPVMPWVVADYTSASLDLANPSTYRDLSKPVGALNAARLAAVKRRYVEMPRGEDYDPPFMWGTHFSTPGYVLYYLVRACPEHMLKLQSGRFDQPDRLFADVASTWAGVTSLNQDVKELTPEFYRSDGSFLLMPEAGGASLDLGVRQNGRRVGDVVLPPWALDAGDFVAQCREALESDYVSERLHGWIDLIFGHKQRGPDAEAADNVYHPVTYGGGVDLEAVESADARAALQAQIAEFGQMPAQLFNAPHAARTGPLVPSPLPSPSPGGPAAAAASPAATHQAQLHSAVAAAAAADLEATLSAIEHRQRARTASVASIEPGSGATVRERERSSFAAAPHDGSGADADAPPSASRGNPFADPQAAGAASPAAAAAAAGGGGGAFASPGNPFASSGGNPFGAPASPDDAGTGAGSRRGSLLERAPEEEGGAAAGETPMDDGPGGDSRRGSVVDGVEGGSALLAGAGAAPAVEDDDGGAALAGLTYVPCAAAPAAGSGGGAGSGAASLPQHADTVTSAAALVLPLAPPASAHSASASASLRRRLPSSAGDFGGGAAVLTLVTASTDGVLHATTLARGDSGADAASVTLGDALSAVPAPVPPSTRAATLPLHTLLYTALTPPGAPLPVTCVAVTQPATDAAGKGDPGLAFAGGFDGTTAVVDPDTGSVLAHIPASPDGAPVTALAAMPVAPPSRGRPGSASGSASSGAPATHRFGPASPELVLPDTSSHTLVAAAAGGTVRLWRVACDRRSSGALSAAVAGDGVSPTSPLAEIAYHSAPVSALAVLPSTRWSDSAQSRVAERDAWLLATGDRAGRVAVHAVTLRRAAPRAMRRQTTPGGSPAGGGAGGGFSVDVDTLGTCDALLPARPPPTAATAACASLLYAFTGVVALAPLPRVVPPGGAGNALARAAAPARLAAVAADGRLALLHLHPSAGGARGADGDGLTVHAVAVAVTGHATASACVDASAGAGGGLVFTGGYDGGVRCWRLGPLEAAARDAVAGGGKRGHSGGAVAAASLVPAEVAGPTGACFTPDAAVTGPARWVTALLVVPSAASTAPAALVVGTRAGAVQLWAPRA